jgi:hypothetical protein
MIDLDMTIPILPLAVLDDLPATLLRYIAGLSARRDTTLLTSLQILPYVTVDGKLQDHSIHVLTDITDSLKHLSEQTRTSHGQEELKKWLDGDDQSSVSFGVVEFWREEFIAE